MGGATVPADMLWLSRQDILNLFGDDERAKAAWVGTLFAEYRIVELAKYGVKPAIVTVKRIPAPDGSGKETEHLFKKMREIGEYYRNRFRKGYIDYPSEKILKQVMWAYTDKDPEYLRIVADELTKKYGQSDECIAIDRFVPVVTELNISPEVTEKVRKLGDKVLEIMAPLGGRAEFELLKLIFSGYKPGITKSIEGLAEEEGNFLENLLDRPIYRAAILFAYRRIRGASMMELLRKMYLEAFELGVLTPKTQKAPPLTVVMA